MYACEQCQDLKQKNSLILGKKQIFMRTNKVFVKNYKKRIKKTCLFMFNFAARGGGIYSK